MGSLAGVVSYLIIVLFTGGVIFGMETLNAHFH